VRLFFAERFEYWRWADLPVIFLVFFFVSWASLWAINHVLRRLGFRSRAHSRGDPQKDTFLPSNVLRSAQTCHERIINALFPPSLSGASRLLIVLMASASSYFWLEAVGRPNLVPNWSGLYRVLLFLFLLFISFCFRAGLYTKPCHGTGIFISGRHSTPNGERHARDFTDGKERAKTLAVATCLYYRYVRAGLG
jgi:hypothetical protein